MASLDTEEFEKYIAVSRNVHQSFSQITDTHATALLRLQRRIQYVNCPRQALAVVPISSHLRFRSHPNLLHSPHCNHLDLGLHLLLHGVVPLFSNSSILGLDAYRC